MDEYLTEEEQWEVRNWLNQNGAWVLAGVAAGERRPEGLALLAGAPRGDAARGQRPVPAGARGHRPQRPAGRDRGRRHAGRGPSAYRLCRPGATGGGAPRGRGQPAAGRTGQAAEDQAETRDDELRSSCGCASRACRSSRTGRRRARHAECGATGRLRPRYAEVRGDALLAKGDRAGALKAYREAQSAQAGQAAASALRRRRAPGAIC